MASWFAIVLFVTQAGVAQYISEPLPSEYACEERIADYTFIMRGAGIDAPECVEYPADLSSMLATHTEAWYSPFSGHRISL